ncbi:hypothetical protein EYF80_038494 [Liparis tanakae]|uniref:Uncharacterized protein n=1 Tax=Liparis tanakae TaxID=230148 RepID=A0A4Z2GDJ1_9TELE|nr:hypothetical protein EYF80_038494 [Liparis tanakae]
MYILRSYTYVTTATRSAVIEPATFWPAKALKLRPRCDEEHYRPEDGCVCLCESGTATGLTSGFHPDRRLWVIMGVSRTREQGSDGLYVTEKTLETLRGLEHKDVRPDLTGFCRPSVPLVFRVL